MSVIDIKNLSVTYFLGKSNEVKALADVNLQIEPGEFIIFFGSSGCGKSTLLYTIAGLERPTTGTVQVAGIDLAHMKNKELEHYRQSTIGMVFQAFHLIPSLSVVKNIMLPRMAIGADPKERRVEAERLMKYFGVYEQRNKLPTELSGGQQQRVAICRALVNNPDIIFADEPVGNLDSKSAHDVLGLIQELNVKGKKTVILVTHDPSHLDIADRVFFMKDGRVLDVKVNAQTRKITPLSTGTTQTTPGALLSSSAEDKKEDSEFARALLEYKAKEVALEALTGLNSDEITHIERYVRDILLRHPRAATKELEQYLVADFEHGGGPELNRKVARRLVEKIRTTTEEIRRLSASLAHTESRSTATIRRLRMYLLETFNVTVHSTDALSAIDEAISDRMNGSTDRKGVQAKLDISIAEGGAGINRRIAKKMAKHLDLIVRGRYPSPIEHPSLEKPISKKHSHHS